MSLRAFPDLHLAVEQMLASGEGVHGCTIVEYRNAKVVHEWVYRDTATLLRPLGALPPLARPAAR